MSLFDSVMARSNASHKRVFGDDVEIMATGEIVRGVFNDPSTVEDMGGFEIDFSKPSLSMPDADADKFAKGDSLRVKGKLYEVARSPVRDGTGWSILSIF